MKGRSIPSVILIFLSAACVDRVFYNTGVNPTSNVVVDGSISSNEGPYTVWLHSASDIESRESRRTELSAQKVWITDDLGNNEVLTEVAKGRYETAASGIRGRVGGIYTLHLSFDDGREYESLPDTIPAPGNIDSVYSILRPTGSGYIDATEFTQTYSFDFYFNATAGESEDLHLLWKFRATFQTDTAPLLDVEGEPCGDIDCLGCSICNLVPKCSGWRNFGTPKDPILKQTFGCSCCTCWYDLTNPEPILSNDQVIRSRQFYNVFAGTVPIHRWVFQHKVYVRIIQSSLTRRSYKFWKAIKDQRTAIGSLFQPVSGRIPSNFIQTAGKPVPIEGLFYAAGESTKTVVIRKEELPSGIITFPEPAAPIARVCHKLYPNATNIKPPFWED